jgi:alpha-galactosidase
VPEAASQLAGGTHGRRAMPSLGLVAALLGAQVPAYNNGPMTRAPPLGWQSWCSVGPCGTDYCSDSYLRSVADSLVSSGMRDLGYRWIIIDDCWHPSRGSDGVLVPHKEWFPHGMPPLIDYIHSKNLSFGLYTSVGDLTCHGGWSPGSFGHFEQDARTFASWGVNWVKVDWCGGHASVAGHVNLSRAMNATGKNMVLSLCRGKYAGEDRWGYAPEIAQVWRSDHDHKDNFASTMDQVASVRGKSSWSSPYNWAYLGEILRSSAADQAVPWQFLMSGCSPVRCCRHDDDRWARMRQPLHPSAKCHEG